MTDFVFQIQYCANCDENISQLHIKCMDCTNVYLCPQCFSSGAEVGSHLKTHHYMFVDHGTFSLFDTSWSANEEQLLIENVEQFGFGNWEDVAENIGTKTAKEVEEHYMEVYIDSYLGKFVVPQDIPNRMTDHTPPLHESFAIQLPQVEVSKKEQIELAYMPNRDDYEHEYDNNAESIISGLFMNTDDSELVRNLKLAKVDMYQVRLQERQRHKDIAREYKLIKTFYHKNENMESNYGTSEKTLRHNLQPCIQFMKQEQLTNLIEGILKEKNLRKKILHLQNYRKYGVTKFDQISSYERGIYKRKKRQISLKIKNDKNLKESLKNDLKYQPSYKMLCNNEKALCNSMQISASDYLTSKGLILKDFAVKQIEEEAKLRYSLIIEKSQRKKLFLFLQANGWIF